MRFLARLATGEIALWCAFWLIGTPLAILWDLSGGCMLLGCGVGAPYVAIFLILLFTLSSVALVFAAVVIWRSSSKYPRAAWWQGPVAVAAKLCAILSGLTAAISFLAVLYLAVSFINAGVLPF